MQRVFLVFLTVFFLGLPSQSRAEINDNTGVYQVADVAVDVTADSASHARDKAILQAQRSALEQLLSRLNTDTEIAARISDDDIAALVQAFEVQQERTSAVRYIGTFTVQFKPNAVRNMLNAKGLNFVEARSTPLVVIPVTDYNGRQILWEETTMWRTIWEETSRSSGLVPLVVPSGDIDDVALLSTAEAISGNPEALQVIIKKYQTMGAVVAMLKTDPYNHDAQKQLDIEVIKYDQLGKASEPLHYSATAQTEANAIKTAMLQVARQIRSDLEHTRKQSIKETNSASAYLPVSVPVNSLAEWNIIKQKLRTVPNIGKINVIVLTKGEAKVELEFRGELQELTSILAQDGLLLEASGPNDAWVLRMASD